MLKNKMASGTKWKKALEENEKGGGALNFKGKLGFRTIACRALRRGSWSGFGFGGKEDDRVLYARKGGEGGDAENGIGGEKIDYDTASTLKTFCWGAANITPRPEWNKTGIIFNEAEQLHAYGLVPPLPKGGAKSFVVILQAYILKHLLFEGKSNQKQKKDNKPNPRFRRYNIEGGPTPSGKNKKEKKGSETRDSDWEAQLLKPNENTQRDILAGAIAEILWKAGEQEEAVVAVPGPNINFEATGQFTFDGVTEKLHLFRCKKEDEIKNAVKRHLLFFMQDKGGGLSALLYSIVLSRNFDRMRSDLQDQAKTSLVDSIPMGEINMTLSNLMLTGKATPYLHNGIMAANFEDSGDFEFGDGKTGITGRNDIGFLLWKENDELTADMNLGSRLKTPTLPIWLTCCNDNYGVLFNPNRDLMKSYHAENRFQLYYFNNVPNPKDKKETILTIDTRGQRQPKQKIDYGAQDEFDEVEEPPLENAVATKWEGAAIDWAGITPYI